MKDCEDCKHYCGTRFTIDHDEQGEIREVSQCSKRVLATGRCRYFQPKDSSSILKRTAYSAHGVGELLAALRCGAVPPHRKDDELLRFIADRIEEAVRNATDKSIVRDWYINSVSHGDSPVWTDAHIDELFEDFYLIPRTKEGEIE